MRRKLVFFDGQRFSEVDPVALRRIAARLLSMLPASSPDDPYKIRSRLVPALELAVSGLVTKPFTHEREFIGGRYVYEYMEGNLPESFSREFQAEFAKFSVAAMSLPLHLPEVENVNGQQFAWLYLEDEDDGSA